MTTLLIKNAQLIDGSGRPAKRADVLVKKDKIIAMRDLIKYKAGKTIDAMGAYLAPGFIDINSQSDRSLEIFNTSQEKNLQQGITSVIVGHSGFSLAPLLYGSLEAMYKFSGVKPIGRKINIDWHSLAEFFKTMKRRSLGVNFGTFIGHSTMRYDIVHDAHQGEFRQLTKNEAAVLVFTARNGLKNGAFGISVGLDNSLTAEASYFEIKKMAELAVEFGVVFSLNMKNNQLEYVKKAIFLAKETGVKIFINNFKPSEQAFDLIEENSNVANVCFGVNMNYESERITNNDEFLKILKSDRALISSGGFQKFLESDILPIEEKIRKITSLPATKFKINKRGLVKEGYFADLVVFKDNQIRNVILNGRRVFENGEYCGIAAGKVLKL